MKIYICNLEENNFFSSYDNYLPDLPEDDQIRITRFIRPEDRARGVAGTLLLRMMAREYLGHDSFVIDRDIYGKPCLRDEAGFFFNLSHSGSYAVAACGNTPVGIDVEICKPHDIQSFKRIYKAEDFQLLHTSPDPLKDFYRIWTTREAWSKKIGKGIALFEADFKVSYETRTITYEGKVSWFNCYDLDGYTLALCHEAPGDPVQIYRIHFPEGKHEEISLDVMP